MRNKNSGGKDGILKIGVTGGIGSGKTLVCNEFRKFGVEVLSADDIARHLMNSNPTVKGKIIHHFGEQSYNRSTNTLESEFIANIVFKKKKKLELLNALVHPFVFKELESRFEALRFSPEGHYCIVEAALMFDTDLHKKVDFILAVAADEKKRIKRVQDRDHLSETDVRERMAHQLPPEEIIEKSDFVLYNDGTTKRLEQNIQFFHLLFQTILSKSTPS